MGDESRLIITSLIERRKEIRDYFNYLTGISTGSILIIVAFLEKTFTQPEGKFLVIISVVGYLVCVIGSVLSTTAVIFTDLDGSSPLRIAILGEISLILSLTGFLTGVISLVIFVIINLIR
jgi:hypothetical protein